MQWRMETYNHSSDMLKKQMFISKVISIFFLEHPRQNVMAGIRSPAACIADGSSSKELFEQLENNFWEHLHEASAIHMYTAHNQH